MKTFEKGDLVIFNSENYLSAKRYKNISEKHFGMPAVILHPFNKIESAWILLDQKRVFVSYEFLDKENETSNLKKESKEKSFDASFVEAWFFEAE